MEFWRYIPSLHHLDLFDHVSNWQTKSGSVWKVFEFGPNSRQMVRLMAVKFKTSAATQTPAADRGLLWSALEVSAFKACRTPLLWVGAHCSVRVASYLCLPQQLKKVTSYLSRNPISFSPIPSLSLSLKGRVRDRPNQHKWAPSYLSLSRAPEHG
jgi:hypothetical protein